MSEKKKSETPPAVDEEDDIETVKGAPERVAGPPKDDKKDGKD